MVNYNNGKIYKIEPLNGEEGDIYIGSTTKEYLSQRMDTHRRDYIQFKRGLKDFVTSYNIFEKYGVENCKIILLELVNANCKDELLSREAYYIKTLQCVNKCIPLRTPKEYRKDNEVKIKQYREDNRDKNIEYLKIYHEANKDIQNEKQRKYHEDNKAILNEKKREYWKLNKKILNEKQHEHYEANKEKLKEISKEYYKINKDNLKEYHKKYREANKEMIRNKQKMYYEAKKALKELN